IDGLALNVDAVHSRRSTYIEDTVSMRYNWDGKPLLLAPNQDGELLPEGHRPGMGQQGEATISDIHRHITNIRSNLAYTIANGHRVALKYEYEVTDREDQNLLCPDRDEWLAQFLGSKRILAFNDQAQTLG